MKKGFIYKYTFPNGKVYIGQSHEGVYRYGYIKGYRTQLVGKAMKKYPNYTKEILCYCCPCLLDFMESYYINKYKSINPEYGYNLDSGGHAVKQISEEHKRKIALKNSKAVMCVELNLEFPSASEAARQLGLRFSHICSCCRGELKTHGGYHWRYL